MSETGHSDWRLCANHFPAGSVTQAPAHFEEDPPLYPYFSTLSPNQRLCIHSIIYAANFGMRRGRRRRQRRRRRPVPWATESPARWLASIKYDPCPLLGCQL